MTLDIFAGEIAQYYSFLQCQVGTAGWGLFILVITMMILLPLIVKRKIKAKDANLLIYHNRQKNLQQKTSQQWENAKTHIEKLLYEITEHQPINESMKCQPVELLADNEQNYYEIAKPAQVDKMLKDRTVKSTRSKRACPPLDIHELQAVASLAKQLQARSRYRVRT
jgi:hypothetical protein